MLIECDGKSLEWVCAAYLSQDKVAKQELAEGLDIHANNQKDLALPDRIIAKRFLFRTIYCDEDNGGAYAFAGDPDYAHVSTSKKYWQQRIDAFYQKYSGLAKWHRQLLIDVGKSSGRLSMPWGREYVFLRREKNGEKHWPKTQIYNYPVQGLGAELMSIVRVSLARRLRALNVEVKLVNTVHDSVLIDTPKENVDTVVKLCKTVFMDVPGNFNRLFGLEFDVALNVEIKCGPNWGAMKVVK